jgi:hypothetical protein
MDPYIESPLMWPDFHANLASEIQAQLNGRIQPGYFARIQVSVVAEEVEMGEVEVTTEKREPDVSVWRGEPVASEGGVAVAVPTIIQAPVQSAVPLEVPLRLRRVEIRKVGTEELISVIEILSRANKRREHRDQRKYLRKRQLLFDSDVHLLEIDLLRDGQRPPLTKPVPLAPYYIVLSRANRRPRAEVWPIALSSLLPVVPVPLREPDPDAPLDLGAAVASVYDRGAYGAQIDYRQPPPPPPLTPEEQAWVDGLLRERRGAV